MKPKLAIIVSHAIQYYAPWFALLNQRGKIDVKVFHTWSQSKENTEGVFDKGFGKKISWDIPLLDGYDYYYVNNTSKNPSDQNFNGIKNPELISKIKEWDANAILVIGWNFHSHLKAMRYFKGKIPVYFRGDSHLLDEKKGIKTLIRRIALKWIYQNIDFACYVGTNNKEYFLKHGASENNLIFTPHSIDNERFYKNNSKLEKEAKDWKNKLGISENAKIVLYCGKFETKKSPVTIVEAAKKFKDNKNLLFLMIGNGHLEKELKEQAKGLKNILFLPFQNQSKMPVVYRLCDIFTLPSIGAGETWGLAVNEASACERPILVSNKVGCAIDLVKNNKNGFIFDAGNTNDFCEKLNKMLSEKNISLKEMGVNSKKIIENWNFNKICQALENSFQKK